MASSVDIVVLIHNNLSVSRLCLDAIIYATRTPYHLWLIDDASDTPTHQFLQEYRSKVSNVTLITHSERQGYVLSCNEGMQQGESPFVVLLNSDVIVPPGWLERLIEAAKSDPKIAVVNPLSNFAANLSLPMAPGCSFIQMDRLLQQKSQKNFPDVVTCVGFCFFLVREHLQDLGLFDPVFGMGYGEDSDFCMRALSKGLRTIVADHVYIYHKGRGSFSNFAEKSGL